MSTQSLIRWSAYASIVTGIVLGFSIVVRFAGLALAAQLSSFTAVLIMIFALTGLYAAQASRSGRLGLAGYILAVGSGILTEVVSFLWIATYAGVAEAHALVMFSWGTLPVLHIAVVGSFAGLLLFGIATARAGVFPRWPGMLMAAGATAYTLSEYIPMLYNVALPSVLVIGISMIWMGAALLSTKTAQGRQASFAGAPS